MYDGFTSLEKRELLSILVAFTERHHDGIHPFDFLGERMLAVFKVCLELLDLVLELMELFELFAQVLLSSWVDSTIGNQVSKGPFASVDFVHEFFEGVVLDFTAELLEKLLSEAKLMKVSLFVVVSHVEHQVNIVREYAFTAKVAVEPLFVANVTYLVIELIRIEYGASSVLSVKL